jgi:Zn-dependent peptidase ImmA (M78 family)
MKATSISNKLMSRIVDVLAPWRSDNGPVELNRVARYWGAVDILYTARRSHGFTEWTPGGPCITLRLSRTDGRRRSTLAHECAHLILDPLVRPDSFFISANSLAHRERVLDEFAEFHKVLQALSNGLGLERLCDLVSIELLLPGAATSRLVDYVTTLERLDTACKEMRVSNALMVKRLNEFGARLSLLRYSVAHDGRYVLVDTAGVPRPWQDSVGISRESASALRELKYGSSTLILHLTAASDGGEVTAEVEKRATSLLMMVDRRELSMKLLRRKPEKGTQREAVARRLKEAI